MKKEKQLPLALFEGKNVLTPENFDYSRVTVGDYVTNDVVNDAINMLPPACNRSGCTQLGEPWDHRYDPNTGKWRPTFPTFSIVTQRGPDAVWEYRGNCFCGETSERGTLPQFVKAGCLA